MVPLDIVYAFPTSNARMAENVTHHVLHRLRHDSRHEVFDLTNGMHLLEKCLVAAIDAKAGLEMPQDRVVSYPTWQEAKEEAKQEQIRSAQQVKAQEQEDRKRQKVEEKERLAEEQRLFRQRAEDAKMSEIIWSVLDSKKLEEADVVKAWLDVTVQPGEATDFVKVLELWKQFQADNKNTKMTSRGFEQILHTIFGDNINKNKVKCYQPDGKETSAGIIA